MIMREITGTGWLTPDGEFIPCQSCEHVSVAERLVSAVGKTRIGIYAEDELRSMGWISITIRNYHEHGYDFIFNHRIAHSDIQISMIKSFAETHTISETGRFHLDILTDE